jgi:hypothetical protein
MKTWSLSASAQATPTWPDNVSKDVRDCGGGLASNGGETNTSSLESDVDSTHWM